MKDKANEVGDEFVNYKENVYPHLQNHVLSNQKVFEPILGLLYQLYLYSAFRSSSRFERNVAEALKPIPEISDELQTESHGFIPLTG
jgi:hypothetical protein